jgi:hypothetical protein
MILWGLQGMPQLKSSISKMKTRNDDIINKSGHETEKYNRDYHNRVKKINDLINLVCELLESKDAYIATGDQLGYALGGLRAMKSENSQTSRLLKAIIASVRSAKANSSTAIVYVSQNLTDDERMKLPGRELPRQKFMTNEQSIANSMYGLQVQKKEKKKTLIINI